MKSYILSIDSLITTFEIIESVKPIRLMLKSNFNDNELLHKFKKNDYILGYYKSPIDGITQIMQVESIESDSVVFKKILDTSNVFQVNEILSDEEYARLQIESNVIEISNIKFNEIYNGLLNLFDLYTEENDNKEITYESTSGYSSEVLGRFIQKIYFGPPGTGKSYNVSKEIIENQIKLGLILDSDKEYNSDYVYRTTIYPEYSYYDFIGNVMPIVSKEGDITYGFQPGIFTLALSKALEVSDKNIPIYLVIEEMSRGNIAGIFGDVFQLLDRDEDGISEYKIDNDIISTYLAKEKIGEYKIDHSTEESSIKEIYLPSNLNILGTVNTSDQNVFVMDTAFKRRFEFEYVDIDPIRDDKTREFLNEYKFKLGRSTYGWNDFYVLLNDYIVRELDLPDDKQIGQFFIKFYKDSPEKNNEQIQNKLLLYLWEDIELIKMTENNLFDEEYKSFSNIYKDFKRGINVFHNSFLEKLSKIDIKDENIEENTSKIQVKYDED